MELDIIMQISNTKHETTKTKVFSNSDAMMQIKANSVDNAIEIFNQEKTDLLKAMNDYTPATAADKPEADSPDEMAAYLKTPAGQRLIKSFKSAKDLTDKKGGTLKYSELQYLYWLATRSGLFNALIDAFNMGYKRGTAKATRSSKKTA